VNVDSSFESEVILSVRLANGREGYEAFGNYFLRIMQESHRPGDGSTLSFDTGSTKAGVDLNED